MVQPAGFSAQDNRTDMGIPVFWASANLDPPWQFKIWFERFLMAVTVKENVNPEVILEEPKDILEELPPRPVTPREGESEAATTARNLREKLARDRVTLENEERKTRGPRVGHNVFYNEDYFCHLVQRERNDFCKRIHMPKYPKCRSGKSQNLQKFRFKR